MPSSRGAHRNRLWVDYSDACPIPLPVAVLPRWPGLFLPARKRDRAELELPEGNFRDVDDSDFKQPRTDYERACALLMQPQPEDARALALGRNPAAQVVPVGPGRGLVFAPERDRFTWWSEHLMLISGASLPDLQRLDRVQWTEELVWRTAETEFLLMNACDHGSDPHKRPHFQVRLESGQYAVHRGNYGWENDDPALALFRFVPNAQAPGASTSSQIPWPSAHP